MKIAIFENEYEAVRGAFDTSNLMDFNGELDLTIYTSSQIANFNKIDEFDAIFVDIDLSQKSELDGFGVINNIKGINDSLVNRIIILTGNNKIQEAMQERGVTDDRIRIIIKPTDYEEISSVLKNMN